MRPVLSAWTVLSQISILKQNPKIEYRKFNSL
jgi:hypothetical protein